MTHSWPQAILHIDGDAFFASCEQALHPEYKGRPVVTGKERGIAAAFSYEAKQLGVTRGMRLFEVKKICPDCIIVPSDYEAYSLISKRMFDIVGSFCPEVEEYSIDEGFADLTGLRRPLHGSYIEIAQRIKTTVESELGISVSVGVSLSKSLAKLASNFRKPSGLTVVPGKYIHILLQKVPIQKVWGIGPNTSAYLQKYGIKFAYDLAVKSEDWVKKMLTKPGVEIWQELNGEYLYKVDPKAKEDYQSISKVKTFTPASKDRQFIYAQLVKNLEAACIKASRYGLSAKKVFIFLKTQQFESAGVEIRLNRVSSYSLELVPHVHRAFDGLFNPNLTYRQTGVVLIDLQKNTTMQYSLFDDPVRIEKIKSVAAAVEWLDNRYGKYTVSLAAALSAHTFKRHLGERGDVPERQQLRLKGERGRQRINLPYFFAKV